jgi:hypothetical protein
VDTQQLVEDVRQLEEAGVIQMRDEPVRDYSIVCLGGVYVHTNGQPFFGCKVYGPFAEQELEDAKATISRLEGGAVFIRPLVSLGDTIRRLSAD